MILALCCVSFALSGPLTAEEKCPISGRPAKDDVFLEVNGKDVHFCCNGCVDTYKKRIGLVDKGPETCPVSGEKASKSHSVIERRAEAVYFCCDKCPEAFAKKHKFERKDEGPKKCPVSGAPAKDDEGTSLIVNGETLYFCCANCPKRYKKELGAVDKGPAKCPVSGGAAKKEVSEIVVKSKVVYFCCGGCKEKYVAKNFKDGVAVTPAPRDDSDHGAASAGTSK
jgi:YHS domain-containing protein